MALPAGESLPQKSFAGAARLSKSWVPFTVTYREYRFQTRTECVRAGTSLQHFSPLKPDGRNTAHAVAIAALFSLEYFG